MLRISHHLLLRYGNIVDVLVAKYELIGADAVKLIHQVTDAGMHILATSLGVIHPCMNAYSLEVVPGNVDLASMGLVGILDNDFASLKDDQGAWKASYLVRTHANAVSMTCGQDMTMCSCTCKCNTKH